MLFKVKEFKKWQSNGKERWLEFSKDSLCSSQLQQHSATAANVTDGEFQKKFQTKGSHH